MKKRRTLISLEAGRGLVVGVRLRTAMLLGMCLSVASLGCAAGAHRIGEEATEGALEGIQEQAADDKMPAVEETAESAGRGFVTGTLDALSAEEQLAELRKLSHALVSQGLRSALGGGLPNTEETPGEGTGPGTGGSGGGAGASSTGSSSGGGTLPRAPGGPVARLSAQMAEAFSAALMAELSRQLGPDGNGPLSTSLAATAQRVAGASVDGAAASARSNAQGLLPGCEGASDVSACLEAKIADVSRSASVGAVQGFQKAMAPWGLLLAFGVGLLLGLVLMLLALTVRLNRRLNEEERRPLIHRREPSHAR